MIGGGDNDTASKDDHFTKLGNCTKVLGYDYYGDNDSICIRSYI